MDRFNSIGVIKNSIKFDAIKLDNFVKEIDKFKNQKNMLGRKSSTCSMKHFQISIIRKQENF